MNLMPIPTLEELAETPAKAKDLPPDVRQALAFRALAVLNALYAAGLVDGACSNGQAEHTVNGDRLLTAKQAGEWLGRSEDVVYRHADQFPFTVRDGRQVRFSEKGIERYIRQRMGGQKEEGGQKCERKSWPRPQ